MIEHINIIETCHRRIQALLDLMMYTEKDCVDIDSVKTASEICQTMLDELMAEVKKIEKEWRENE